MLARVARHPARRARHDRRLPLPQRRARAPGHLQRKGFPESYDRRALAASSRRSSRAGTRSRRPRTPHLHLRHRARTKRIVVRSPTCSSSRASTCCQAPEVHPVRGTGLAGQRLLRLLACTSTPGSTNVRTSCTSSASCACARRRSPTPTRTSTATPCSPTTRPSRREPDLARDQRPNLVENIPADAVTGDLVLSKGDNHEVRRVRLAQDSDRPVSRARMPGAGPAGSPPHGNDARGSVQYASARERALATVDQALHGVCRRTSRCTRAPLDLVSGLVR
jgi:hypothetical protein